MAYPWMPTIYNVSGRTNSWISGIVQHHDTFCGCDQPFFHLYYKLKKDNGYPHCSPQELNKIEKCLGVSTTAIATEDIGTDPTPDDGPEELLKEGDLDALFEGELTEEDHTG